MHFFDVLFGQHYIRYWNFFVGQEQMIRWNNLIWFWSLTSGIWFWSLTSGIRVYKSRISSPAQSSENVGILCYGPWDCYSSQISSSIMLSCFYNCSSSSHSQLTACICSSLRFEWFFSKNHAKINSSVKFLFFHCKFNFCTSQTLFASQINFWRVWNRIRAYSCPLVYNN